MNSELDTTSELDSKNVSLEEAQKAVVTIPEPDKMAHNETRMFEHTENMQTVKLGWIGKFLGAKSEKPGNVSAMIAILLVLYLGILIFVYQDSELFSEVFAGITSIVTLILGYLFGSSDKS